MQLFLTKCFKPDKTQFFLKKKWGLSIQYLESLSKLANPPKEATAQINKMKITLTNNIPFL